MAAARLVALSLRDDVGFPDPMVAVAAMQTAKRVICTGIPVVGQCFCDGLTGLACPISDVDRIVELIARWYEDGPGAERMGSAVR